MKEVSELKYIYYVLSMIPAGFLFHYYEYGQRLKGEEAIYLFQAWLVYILVIGLMSTYIKKSNVILLYQILSCILSVLLARFWLADDSAWFAPFRRDVVVILTSGITYVGQLIIRFFIKAFIGNVKSLLS
ncbi:MAG: hypothetical protein K0R71_1701 [Bacillales bacterium]|jgi:hypothetical protein|nr:hypothetical protein [Bacillales bacterium]